MFIGTELLTATQKCQLFSVHKASHGCVVYAIAVVLSVVTMTKNGMRKQVIRDVKIVSGELLGTAKQPVCISTHGR